MYNVQFIYVSIICRMLYAYTDKSHLDVTWVSQSLYSGPLSNPDFFLSLIAGRIRQVVLYIHTHICMLNIIIDKMHWQGISDDNLCVYQEISTVMSEFFNMYILSLSVLLIHFLT